MGARSPRIAFVAASSVVPRIDLEAGVQRLAAEGFETFIHPQCFESHFVHAGPDARRAEAFWEVANDPKHDVIWVARGGYGAARILPILEGFTKTNGPPPRKLLVGYSDVTPLHEFVRRHWNWPTLHAQMPAELSFGQNDPVHWRGLLDLVRGKAPGNVWGTHPLKWLNTPATASAELIGGNLSLWAAAVGTPCAPTPGRGRFVFFEDVGEKHYRIDRMLTQIRQAGLLDGATAILLGDFTACDDDPVKMINGPGGVKIPLRRQFKQAEALAEIFATLPIPVAIGLPVGHGPNFAPLPLGAAYRVSAEGAFEMEGWDWLSS